MFNQVFDVCTVEACTVVIQDKDVRTVVIRFRELDEDDAVFNQFQEKCAISTVARLCFQIGVSREQFEHGSASKNHFPNPGYP